MIKIEMLLKMGMQKRIKVGVIDMWKGFIIGDQPLVKYF